MAMKIIKIILGNIDKTMAKLTRSTYLYCIDIFTLTQNNKINYLKNLILGHMHIGNLNWSKSNPHFTFFRSALLEKALGHR